VALRNNTKYRSAQYPARDIKRETRFPISNIERVLSIPARIGPANVQTIFATSEHRNTPSHLSAVSFLPKRKRIVAIKSMTVIAIAVSV
jgi:hypothetical protein